MKHLIKQQITILIGVIYFLSFAMNPTVIRAESSLYSACGYIPEAGVNPSIQTINCLLTEAALAKKIPPEVVKAIAEKESGWKQFTETGEPLVSKDGGIGMMQITWTGGFDVEKLKTDLVYNIEAGVQLLNDNFNRKDLPKINDNARDVIEHWYFAIMAFNGIKPMNSPVVQADGTRNLNAYQEKVFEIIEKQSLLDLKQIPFKTSDFNYNTGSTANIQFVTKTYSLPANVLNGSKYFFQPMDKGYIAIDDVRLRNEPSTTGPIVKVLKKDESVTILKSFTFDPLNFANTFAWNLVKLEDGQQGYVAASYINRMPSSTTEPKHTNQNGNLPLVPANKAWTVEFNAIVDRNSVTNETVLIKDENKNIVPTVVEVNNKTIVIKPIGTYESGKTYTIYIKRVKSAAGIPLVTEVTKAFTVQ